MGLKEFWDDIKDQDTSVPLAKLAEEHYKRHGRPLRIAIDEADWRFHNLTPQQVFQMREISNKPFQGIEKLMFFRICYYLTLNIQLIFVFDGPSRPWKNGKRGGNRVDYEGLRLTKETLRLMRVPFHQAPGEAEAECARLQQLGIVDAVFSQDSDSLMFGCGVLIRDDRIAKIAGVTSRRKDNTSKSKHTVRIVKLEDISRVHGYDRQGLVLWAMLVGGDYEPKGLDGCGPAAARRAIRAGLGTSLCLCRTQQDCLVWRQELLPYVKRVPLDFPDIKTLTKYNNPKVSADDQLLNLRALRTWDQAINERDLLDFIGPTFNYWGKSYMDWIGPILLVKSFVQAQEPLTADSHEIRLVKKRAKNDSSQPEWRNFIREITFSPFGLTSLPASEFIDKPGYWSPKENALFDPGHRVKCEFPEYWLQRGVPAEVMNPPTPAPRETQKRKRPTDEDTSVQETPDPAPYRGKTRRQPIAASIIPSPSALELNSPLPALRAVPTASTPNNRTPQGCAMRPSPLKRSAPTFAPVIDLVSDNEFDDLAEYEELDFGPIPSTVSSRHIAADSAFRTLLPAKSTYEFSRGSDDNSEEESERPGMCTTLARPGVTTPRTVNGASATAPSISNTPSTIPRQPVNRGTSSSICAPRRYISPHAGNISIPSVQVANSPTVVQANQTFSPPRNFSCSPLRQTSGNRTNTMNNNSNEMGAPSATERHVRPTLASAVPRRDAGAAEQQPGVETLRELRLRHFSGTHTNVEKEAHRADSAAVGKNAGAHIELKATRKTPTGKSMPKEIVMIDLTND